MITQIPSKNMTQVGDIVQIIAQSRGVYIIKIIHTIGVIITDSTKRFTVILLLCFLCLNNII